MLGWPGFEYPRAHVRWLPRTFRRTDHQESVPNFALLHERRDLRRIPQRLMTSAAPVAPPLELDRRAPAGAGEVYVDGTCSPACERKGALRLHREPVRLQFANDGDFEVPLADRPRVQRQLLGDPIERRS